MKWNKIIIISNEDPILLIENKEESNILAILVDDEGREYDMTLPRDGYEKSLFKAKEYFTMIEEYETCDLIKQIQKQIA